MRVAYMPNFTRTEKRLLAVLSDGKAHPRHELMACLNDELSERVVLRVHFSQLRKKLRPLGQDILCVYHMRSFWYQHVRLMCQPSSQ
jgi:DNA-binding response OmpR family regulator